VPRLQGAHLHGTGPPTTLLGLAVGIAAGGDPNSRPQISTDFKDSHRELPALHKSLSKRSTEPFFLESLPCEPRGFRARGYSGKVFKKKVSRLPERERLVVLPGALGENPCNRWKSVDGCSDLPLQRCQPSYCHQARGAARTGTVARGSPTATNAAHVLAGAPDSRARNFAARSASITEPPRASPP